MKNSDEFRIRFGHSPDPDDAFMFYAIAKAKIPMRGFRVEHVIEDIESLNRRALKAELEVTAVSCHAYAYLADAYAVMTSGASVGDRYGPILVSGKPFPVREAKDLAGKKIAVPGEMTTALLALKLFAPEVRTTVLPFDRIFEGVRSGRADLGLVIHEGQLTYAQSGFHLAIDLGRWWHGETGLPLPLGIDVIRKDLGADRMRAFAGLFREAILYALGHRAEALDYALEYGRGIGRDLGDRFVGMYVNESTVEMGSEVRKGFELLLKKGQERGLLPKPVTPEYVEIEKT
ncbi:MAG: menaquinone biosynthesis family protein [Candidatus Omnitrophota bacterium]